MKKNKMLICLLLFVILFVSFDFVSYASNNTSIIPDVGPILSGNGSTEAKELLNKVVGFLRWMGYAVAIGMVMFVGIKYMISSADERASMKGLLVKVVIGALIIIFANVIVNIVISVTL